MFLTGNEKNVDYYAPTEYQHVTERRMVAFDFIWYVLYLMTCCALAMLWWAPQKSCQRVNCLRFKVSKVALDIFKIMELRTSQLNRDPTRLRRCIKCD